MAYNKANYLIRVLEIQKITLEHKKKGHTQEWIYANHIADQFHISKSTYSNYLGINTALERSKQEAKRHTNDSL